MWIIQCEVVTNMKVCFDEEITAEEAMERFENDDYEDILDEDTQLTTAQKAY